MTDADLDKKIDSWKEQLLDLTRRNNMVDFSATKTKSLPTKHTDWPTVADQLAQDNDLYVWNPPDDEPAPADDSPSQVSPEDNELVEIAQQIEGEHGEDRAHESATAAQPEGVDRPDNELISIRDPDQTERSLYNISLQQRKYLQEKGVDALYMALGMLEWSSVDYADTILRSPLFLASVSIDRETVSDPARHDYVITSDDEVILNPALRKKLKGDHDLPLPKDDGFDLTSLKEAEAAVADRISGFEQWELTNEVILGIFDFAKLSLYNDLEENRAMIKANPVVRALHGDASGLNTAASEVPAAEELDQAVDPADMFQVLEADSSQQVAIEAAKEGVSYVLQGPPGTGKSQTIANIIAEKMAAGETILFVSEKQAALDVVKNRLDDVGLGRFCLPAHGKKATKEEVLTSLERELNAPQIKEASMRPARLGKLRKRRAEINEYGELLLAEYGEIQTSAYEAHGILADLEKIPAPSWTVEAPLSVSADDLKTAREALQRLAGFDNQLDQFETHPWRHVTLRTWQVDTTDRMRASLRQQQTIIDDLMSFTATLDQEVGIELTAMAELEDAMAVLEHLQSTPDVEWTDRWFEPAFYRQREQLETLAKLGRDRAELRASIDEQYTQSFYSEDGADLHAQLNEYGVLRYLSRSYRRLKRRILNHATGDYDPDIHQLREDTRQLMEFQALDEQVKEYDELVHALGHLYDGDNTDWDRALTVQAWVREVADTPIVETKAIPAVLQAESGRIQQLLERGQTLHEQWQQAAEFFTSAVDTESLTTPEGTPLYQAPFDVTRSQLRELEGAVSELKDWVQFHQSLTEVQNTIASDYIDAFLAADIAAAHLVDGFEKEFYTDFVNAIYEQTALGQFNPAQHEKTLQQFRRLDKTQQELAKVEIQHRVTTRRPTMSLEHASSAQQVVLRREIEKQRRRKPLRDLFDEAGDMITRLKPCLMMSPLSVAQHLKAESITFDAVIFDEASQIMPQDAISSIVRADQVVIAGDTKQLPPTQFFAADVDPADDVRADLESILEEAAAVLPEKHLRWHYRSRTDELIEFSNQKYYAGRLNTFPENNPDVPTGVEFEYVEDGVYDRGGSRQNMPEARRVVDMIETFVADAPDKSVGVVAFSEAQERAIRDIIEERRRDDPVLDKYVDETDPLEGFFVKNLESVQGDERDVMLFSVGYGPDQSGKITMNFGPLNNDGGERRLNVAVTRARERVIVVSSLQPGDIDLSRTNASGVKDFKTYLEYAKKGERALVRDDEPTETLVFDSTFEEAVYTALEDAGHNVETQIQSSGYSIDLAIRHPDRPGEYLLGIECDGAAYHSSKTARDRDRTRQLILEDLGWEIHRIWSPDWVSNREQELDTINEKVEMLLDAEEIDTPTVDVAVSEEDPEPAEPPELDGGQTGFRDYDAPDPEIRRDCDFESIPNRTLRQELAALVETYGPIDRDEAFTVLVQQWYFSRVGKSMRRTLIGITTHLDGSRLTEVDGFLWPLGLKEVPVRVNTDAASRSVDQIPIQELAKAAYIILENGISMDRDDLVLETARKFGWARRGKNIEQRIDTAIDYLLAIGAAEEGDHLTATGVDIDAVILDEIYEG